MIVLLVPSLTVRFRLLPSSVILWFEAPDITESGFEDSIEMLTFGQSLKKSPLPDSELMDGVAEGFLIVILTLPLKFSILIPASF